MFNFIFTHSFRRSSSSITTSYPSAAKVSFSRTLMKETSWQPVSQVLSNLIAFLIAVCLWTGVGGSVLEEEGNAAERTSLTCSIDVEIPVKSFSAGVVRDFLTLETGVALAARFRPETCAGVFGGTCNLVNKNVSDKKNLQTEASWLFSSTSSPLSSSSSGSSEAWDVERVVLWEQFKLTWVSEVLTVCEGWCKELLAWDGWNACDPLAAMCPQSISKDSMWIHPELR